jgi:hypothetical protein
LHNLLLCLGLLSSNIYGFALPDSQPKTDGLYVKNEIGIFVNAQLVTFGDVYLDSANITGSGQFSFNGLAPQTLNSKASTVANLLIANPTTVTLKGHLLLTNSLSLQKGIFDSQKGILSFENSIILNISKHAKWIQVQSEIMAHFSCTPQLPQGNTNITNPLAMVAFASSSNTKTKKYNTNNNNFLIPTLSGIPVLLHCTAQYINFKITTNLKYQYSQGNLPPPYKINYT